MVLKGTPSNRMVRINKTMLSIYYDNILYTRINKMLVL